MKVIDVHAHVYPKVAGITQGEPISSGSLGRVTIGNRQVQFLPPSFEQSRSTADMLIAYMDWCKIDQALLMPNPYYGYHNAYFEESVLKYPKRLRGVALVDILKGEAAAGELAEIYDRGELFGFKIEVDSTFQCAPGKRMTDLDLAPVWDCCSQYHQPVFIHMFHGQDIADIKQLTGQYPHITFIICHMGADACFGKQAQSTAYEEVLELVRTHDNVYMDTSTVPVYFQEEYPFPASIEIIERAYQSVGAGKLMWASDYPGMLNHATMKQLINMVMNGCSRIPYGEKEMIMGGTANQLFFASKGSS